MRRSFLILLGIVVSALIGGTGALSWAQSSCINVKLNFDKAAYSFGEPVGAGVVVTNGCGRDIWISNGFMEKVYYLEMQAIDPAGRQLTGAHPQHDEFPDAPPVGFFAVPDPNNPNAFLFLRAVPCELLPANGLRA